MGTVSTAVAERDAAPAKPDPVQVIKQTITSYRSVIGRLLKPTGINEETFVAQIANACRATPDLWLCDPETVLGAALKCAQLGLAPNDTRNLAWIIPYGGKATFQIGYGGVMELARRAVPGLRFDGRPVYPNDVFDVDYGEDQPLTHRPAIARTPRMDRGGDAFAWYVRAKFPDGAVQIHALDREGVEYHRKFSKQPDGLMWRKSYDAAAVKSVVMDMKRWLPSSAQMVVALGADERVIDVRTIENEPIEATYEAPGTEALPKGTTEPPDDVNGDTGEILTGQLVTP